MKVAVCSISSRKDCLLKTIESLMKQTVPCEIHVLLSEEPFLLDKGFPNKQAWPELEQLPVTIHWVPNWASYRKTVSFMKFFPNDVFFAIDDDEYFHPSTMKFIENMYEGGVMAFRATHYSDVTYNQWEDVMTESKSVYHWTKGNGGVVYDSKLFQDPNFFNEKAFLELAPTSDDVWVNLWRMYHNIPVHVYPMRHFPMPQAERLWFYNETKNDLLIQNVRGHMNNQCQCDFHKNCRSKAYLNPSIF